MNTRESTDCPEWQEARVWNMPALLERCTLHDAELSSIIVEPAGQILVACHLDLIWNKMIPSGFDSLVLAFERPYSMKYIFGKALGVTIGDAMSTVCSEGERSALIDSAEFDVSAYRAASEVSHPAFDETLTRTVFTTIYDDRIVLLHSANIRCRCFSEDGESLDMARHLTTP
jgi:hypothetical protein